MASHAHVPEGGPGGLVAHGLAARLTAICAGLALLIGALVLANHLLWPQSGLFSGPAMKANTALCIFTLGAAQVRLLQCRARPSPLWGVLLAVALVLTIAAATLCESLFGLELGIDNLLVSRPLSRMSGMTAVALIALGTVAGVTALRLRAAVLCQTLLVIAALCALLPILGYLYRAPLLYGAATAVAPGTALAGLSLTIGFVSLRSDEGLWPLLVGNSAGSAMLRRALPAVILLPATFGWLRLQALQLGVGLELGSALIAVVTALTFATLLVSAARSLHTQDHLRRAASEKLLEAHATLELRVEERTRELKQTEVELRRAADKLLVAKEAAESAMRARADFLARMSHEIRTPLNGVVGMLEILIRGQLTPAQRGYVETARSSAEALLSLISEILDFSKIDAGKLQLEVSTFRLRDCAAQALRDSAHGAHQKGLELYLYIDSNVPECLVGDRQRLRQVITNLVANAVKFTERGEVKLSITIVRRVHTEVELAFEVADTGMGIAREKQEEIFLAFTQGDETTTRRFGGTGLGLAISAQLVQLMGGRISVDSEPGKGARFSFRIELGVDHRAELELDAARAAFAGTRALIVFAQAAQRELVSELLEHWGIEANSVAIAAVQRKLREARDGEAPYAFLLLDDQAAGTQSESFLDQLRDLAGPRFPIVLITSATPADSARELRLKYASLQLTKPILASELFEAVAGLLNEAAIARPSDAERAPRSPLRVLIAEDNEVNRRVACFLLQDAGYQVVAVEDGKKAVAALAAQSFDVVLMDGHMPELDGIEATRVIRERERGSGRHTPIIALTAQAMQGDRERYFAAGMDGYLSKPFQSSQLHAAIRDVLGKSPSSALRAQLVKQEVPTPRSEGSRGATRARASVAVYDRAALLSRLRGLESVLRQMVIVFAEEAPELLANVRRALDTGDSPVVQKAAHKLAGALLTVSGNRAGETARTLENAARAGELNDGEALFEKLSQELIALHQALRQEGDLGPEDAAASSDAGDAARTPDRTP